ncbi:MAG: hypothetical protein COA32_10455 [Fluviicola sp.]|nr:MAG: hypothetical protein COA32_10455 [Fluviicola sp.]
MELKIINNYFENGVCSAFDLIPFNSTSHQMNNYRILKKREKNTFSFYAGINSTESFEVDTHFNGLEDIYFQLINNDSLFFNYTDIPSISDNELYYFQNGINANKPEFFQKTQFVAQQDLIGLRSKRFNVNLTNEDKEVILEIKSNSETVITKTISGIKIYSLNLSQFDNGVYQLWVNDQLQETFFMSDQEVDQNCIGVVRLNVKEVIDQYSNNLDYTINFNARNVFWQYQVVVSKSRKIQVHDMNISGIKDEKYQGPVDQEIIGGQTAQVFITSSPLQLQNKLEQNPQLQVTYSNDFSNRKNQVEIKLPNPDVEQIKKYNQGENEGSFFSSTIVYV